MEVGVNWRSQPHFSLLFLIELLSKLLSQIIMKSTITALFKLMNYIAITKTL